MFKQLAQNQKNQDIQLKIQSEALLRLKTDLDEIRNNQELLNLGKYQFPQDDNEYEFTFTYSPNKSSLWHKGIYTFKFIIPPEFPHNKGPSVKCLKRIFHPNIDFDGNVCLNILREDYNPTVTIKMIIFGLISLFEDLNPTNPLNIEVAQIMKDNFQQFQSLVQASLKGHTYKNITFERFI